MKVASLNQPQPDKNAGSAKGQSDPAQFTGGFHSDCRGLLAGGVTCNSVKGIPDKYDIKLKEIRLAVISPTCSEGVLFIVPGEHVIPSVVVSGLTGEGMAETE
ncbi:hypothetical protein HA49_15015 [Tatumella morbirosei]|uniref:Uncharacterized protein n=1 Tax=Tatumella morbirosei TaxID=642227 RepID=A0A095T5B2_9GAMM|nr:hypothetical protein HA49_15015 [Tatumella morbirosei]